MIWEGEKKLINPSNIETKEGNSKNLPSFKEKISIQLAKFSPELKNKVIQLLTQHHNVIKNENLFLRKLSRSLQEKSEEEIPWIIERLIKNEIQQAEEQEDIWLHEPTLTAHEWISEQTQSTTQETQSTINSTNQKTGQIDTDQAKIDTGKTKNDTIQTEIKNLFERTQVSLQALNPKYTSHTEAQLKTKTDSLSPQVKKKLQESHISTLDYASFLLSREKIGNDTSSPENQVFLESLKNLEKNLWIPETYAGGFFKSFEPQTETFTQNPDLAQYAKENQDFSPFDQLNYFPENSPIEEDQNLIQKFWSPQLQEFSQKIQPLLKKAKEQLIDDEKTIITNYEQQIKQLKGQLETKAKNFMKASITNAPINAILKYLDSESLWNQTLSDLLEKPKSWSFAQIHQEGKDQVLHFQGTIDGNPITFYYNLSDPNATLECDDCLYYDTISKTLSLNKGSGTRTKLNIQMPTTEQLATNLHTACSPEKFQEILEHSSNPKEYQQQFSQLISWTLEKSFSDKQLIKSRLARHTEKNLAIQAFESTLIPPEIMQQLTSGKQLNENLATKQLFKLLDRSSEQSTSSELQSFRRSLQKRESMLQSPEKIKHIQDSVLRSCLEKYADTKLKKSDFQAWNKAMLDFFNLFTRQTIWEAATNTDNPNYVLNFNDFNRFVAYLDKPDKSITDDQQLQNFSPTFQEKYEKQKANMQESDALTSLEVQIKESFEVAYT